MDIAARLLPATAESYCIHRYAVVQPPLSAGGGTAALEEAAVEGGGGQTPGQRRVRLRWHRIACRAGESAFATASFASRTCKLRGAVFVDSVEPQVAQRATLLQLLQQHLTWHLVRAPGQRYFHQSHGIPQGSVISTVRCTGATRAGRRPTCFPSGAGAAPPPPPRRPLASQAPPPPRPPGPAPDAVQPVPGPL
jgi:hypothetical protein